MDGHIVVSSADLFFCFLTILKFFPCLACSFVCSLILRLLSVAVLLSLFHISFSFLSLSFLSPFTSPSCSYASLLHNSNQKHDRSIFFSVLRNSPFPSNESLCQRYLWSHFLTLFFELYDWSLPASQKIRKRATKYMRWIATKTILTKINDNFSDVLMVEDFENFPMKNHHWQYRVQEIVFIYLKNAFY